MAFKPIETQEELDKIINERLEKEKVKIEAEFSEMILEKVAAKDTEIKELQGKIKGYEKSEMQRKIAFENKIPFALAERIKGETEEEMLQDAKNLSSYFKDFEEKEKILPEKNPEMVKGGAYERLLENLKLV